MVLVCIYKGKYTILSDLRDFFKCTALRDRCSLYIPTYIPYFTLKSCLFEFVSTVMNRDLEVKIWQLKGTVA